LEPRGSNRKGAPRDHREAARRDEIRAELAEVIAQIRGDYLSTITVEALAH